MSIEDHAWTFLLYAVPPGGKRERLVERCYVDQMQMRQARDPSGLIRAVNARLCADVVEHVHRIEKDEAELAKIEDAIEDTP